MTEREPAIPDIPRLAGNFDVRQLARVGTMASGEVTVGSAGTHTNDHVRAETHNENRSAWDGFTSMTERLRRWQQTTVGRWTTILVMAGPTAGLTAAMAACGGHPEKPAGIVANGPEQAGGAAGAAGGDQAPSVDRKIIGDAACYDGFATLSLEKQEACIDAFNDFTLDQVTSLSPLDQARWALGYREKLSGDQPGSEPDRLTFTSAITKERPLNAITNLMLQNHVTDVTRLAWMMQQPDKTQAEDPRTWAALFGIGTDAGSQAVKDAKALAENNLANGADFDTYLRSTVVNTQLFSTAPQEVKATPEEDGGFTVTFNAVHNSDDQTTAFTYRYYPYLFVDGDGAFRQMTPDDEVKILQGKPLIGAPVVKNA